MSARTLLWGANGDPLVVDMGPQERNVALLVEIFGRFIEYEGPSTAPLTVKEILPIIADICKPEVLEARYKGLKLEVTRRKHAAGSES